MELQFASAGVLSWNPDITNLEMSHCAAIYLVVSECAHQKDDARACMITQIKCNLTWRYENIEYTFAQIQQWLAHAIQSSIFVPQVLPKYLLYLSRLLLAKKTKTFAVGIPL